MQDGVRVDTGVAQGKTPSAKYDPLLAKLICSVPAGQSFDDCVQLSLSSLQSYKMDGVKTNINQLLNILSHPEMTANNVYTAFMSDFAADVGNTVSKKKKKKAKKKVAAPEGPPTSIPVFSPFPGQVAEFKVKVGDKVEPGQTVAVVSAMKMLNDIPSPGVGVVTAIGSAVEAQIDETVALVTIEGHVMAVEEEEDEFDDAAPVAAAPGGGGDGAFISRAWAADEDTFGVYGRSAPRIRSKIKTDDATYKDRHAHHSALAATLQERLQLVRQGGGGKYVKLHRKRGKFLARERIEQIIDPGSRFLELSALAAWDKHDGKVMSAGVVTGIGLVHGRECMFQCNDATVKGGIAFPETFKKQSRAQEIAQANRLPCVYLVDGGGANLSADNGGDGAMTVGFVEYGKQFRNQSIMSSMKIPQIACVLGQCTAGGAYVPALSDEVVHVNGGNIYLGGPPLVKAATGEIATQEQLGGAAMHTSKSGVSDHYAENEEEALHKVRTIIEHLQRPAKVQLPMLNPEPPAYSPEELLGVVPEDTKIPFDVREVIARIVDGSRFHEFKPRYGSTIVCGWGHIHGYPIGILGNNGMLFSESAIKAAHFIENCGQRGTPLLFLHNITGFIIGTKYEQGGIAKDGAKMIMAVSCAPVPKFSVVLAGSHGAGNYAMCGPAFDPRFTFLWPNAKISVMGGKQAADVITTVKDGQLKREGKPPLSKEQIEMMQEPIIDAFESTNSAYHSTANVFDDGVIDPRHTRDTLGMAISISLNAPKMTNGYGVFRM
jgi:3-methylcrotonyl-CoA carboxylase beta subunit